LKKLGNLISSYFRLKMSNVTDCTIPAIAKTKSCCSRINQTMERFPQSLKLQNKVQLVSKVYADCAEFGVRRLQKLQDFDISEYLRVLRTQIQNHLTTLVHELDVKVKSLCEKMKNTLQSFSNVDMSVVFADIKGRDTTGILSSVESYANESWCYACGCAERFQKTVGWWFVVEDKLNEKEVTVSEGDEASNQKTGHKVQTGESGHNFIVTNLNSENFVGGTGKQE